MSDEQQQRIEKAAAALKAHGAREVYVFGSVLEARFDPEYSDIDMAMAGLPEVFFRAMGATMEFLDRDLDLVDLDEENTFTMRLKERGKMRRVA